MATSRRATPRRSGPAHRRAQTDAARRQAALLRLTTAIAAATGEREVYRSMVNGLHDEALGYNFLGAFLLDEASGDRVLQASVGWPDVPLDWHVHRGQGLSERALQDGQLHYTPDVTRAAGYLPSLASGSEVDVPLRVDGRTIGVLVVESSEPNAFGAEDFEILTAAANQASIAIGRARLLAEERRRVDEHKALLDTMADLSSDLELPRVLQAVLNRAVTLLGVTGGEVAIYEGQAKQLEVVASQNIGKDSTGTRLSLGEGAMGHVARTREPLIIPSYHEWLGRSGQYADVTVHSVMAAPLLIGRRLVGAIATVHADPSRIFGAEDLRLLNLFAPQAAIAIENARLFTAERDRAGEQKALLDTMADLSGELELPKVLQAVLARAVTLLGVTGGEVAIFDEARQELVVVASEHIGKASTGTRLALGEGAMGTVARTLEPLIIPSYKEWLGRSGKYADVQVHSVMAAPLLIGRRLVGAIATVHADPSRIFGAEDLRLLNLFAPQAAIAIENARLFTAERDRAGEQKALLDTMADLSGELELPKVLQAVLARAVTLLGVTGGEVAIFDEARQELEVVASEQIGKDSTGTRLKPGEGAMGAVALTLQPLIIPSYKEWLGRSGKYADVQVHSVMVAPLLIGGRLVGAIALLHSDPARVFGEEDLRRLNLFAPQAAIAIENA